MAVVPLGLGTVNTAGVAELIAKTYDPIFVSLRDTEPSVKKLLFPDTREGNDVIRFHIDANDKNVVRPVSEAELNSIIDNTILDTAIGSGGPVAAGPPRKVLTPNLHPVVDANLDIRHFIQTTMIGSKQLAAIKGGKDSFQNILTREQEQNVLDWARGIDDMLITFPDNFKSSAAAAGDSGRELDNLGTMLAVGAPNPGYCGVRYDTYNEWAPYVSSAGAARPLSIALLQDCYNKLMGAIAGDVQRQAKTDMIIMGAGQFTNYGNLLTAQRRFTGSETMDGGFKTLEFNGIKVVLVPRWSANKVLFAQKTTRDGEKSFEYRILKNYAVSDKSDNIVDGVLFIAVHMANALCKGRMQQGVITDLS